MAGVSLMPDPTKTTVPPDPPRDGCYFCDGTGIVNQASYDQAVLDKMERIAWKPGSRCMCTYSWAEIAGSVADICTEVANGKT